MTEDPLVFPDEATDLSLTFASATIKIMKEEEAYSFLSFVADCGGVLGLFIGFNFLMIWDWTFIAFTRFLPQIKNHILPEKSATDPNF